MLQRPGPYILTRNELYTWPQGSATDPPQLKNTSKPKICVHSDIICCKYKRYKALDIFDIGASLSVHPQSKEPLYFGF